MQAEASGSSQPAPSSVRTSRHSPELDCLPDGPGNAPPHDPTIHWNSSTINGLPRGRRAVPPSRDMPSRASPSDRAPPQACVTRRLSGREWGPEFAPGRGLAPVRSRPQSSGHSTAKRHPRRVWGSILLCTLVHFVNGYEGGEGRGEPACLGRNRDRAALQPIDEPAGKRALPAPLFSTYARKPKPELAPARHTDRFSA
jgi:hypothetical protein